LIKKAESFYLVMEFLQLVNRYSKPVN